MPKLTIFSGVLVGDVFDRRAAFGRDDKGDFARRAIDKQGQIKFPRDGRAIFNVEPVDLLARNTGLCSHQGLAEHSGRLGTGFLR